MLAVVKRLMPGKAEDFAALQHEIQRVKAEGAAACAEIERLEQERALCPSYQAALELDGRCKELRWTVDHARAVLPDLEQRLARAAAEKRQAGLARHHAIAAQCYRKLRAALVEAGRLQTEAIRAREDAVREIGEALVQLHLPIVTFRGMVTQDLLQMYFDQLDRVFDPPRPKPKPVAVQKPPAPAKPKQAVAVPAPRPARVVRHDPFPSEGQQLVVFIRAGTDLGDGTIAGIGDQLSLPIEQARQLVLRGAAEYVNAEGSESNG